MTNEKVDVVIVGAGASGSVYASVLAKAGKKVLLLESGPDWELSDLISSEIWGRRVKPAGAPILLEGAERAGPEVEAQGQQPDGESGQCRRSACPGPGHVKLQQHGEQQAAHDRGQAHQHAGLQQLGLLAHQQVA